MNNSKRISSVHKSMGLRQAGVAGRPGWNPPNHARIKKGRTLTLKNRRIHRRSVPGIHQADGILFSMGETPAFNCARNQIAWRIQPPKGKQPFAGSLVGYK